MFSHGVVYVLFVFMADTLSSLWKNFSLSEKESLRVAVVDQALSVITESGASLCGW